MIAEQQRTCRHDTHSYPASQEQSYNLHAYKLWPETRQRHAAKQLHMRTKKNFGLMLVRRGGPRARRDGNAADFDHRHHAQVAVENAVAVIHHATCKIPEGYPEAPPH